MRLLMQSTVLGYLGVLALQAYMGVRGQLTETRFAVLQVASLSLIMISAVLRYARPEYPLGLLIGVLAVLTFCVVGYPFAKWLYREFLRQT
jgi:hypothetical protein